MAKTKQIQKETLDLEGGERETPLELELKQFEDPAKQEEAKKRLADLAAKLEQLTKDSEITIKKIYAEAKQEKGLIGWTAHFIKRLGDRFKSDGSTSYDSINFLTGTVRSINDYRQKIPLHIKEFQKAIDKLKLGQEEAKKIMRQAKKDVERLSKEWEQIKQKVDAETNKVKKEELKIKEQDSRDALHTAEILGNKYMKKLQNYTYTREMFLGLKESYEVLLQQLGDLEVTLQEHLKILKTVGPSVREVQNVVLAINRFTQVIDDYRKRDNLAVRYSTAAVKEISPSVQHLENPWYGKKTVEIVKQNAKEAKEIYKNHFGKDIKTFDDYNGEDKEEEDGNPD